MSALATALRKELRAHADPKRAAGAQAYMKSAMPYYGLYATTLRAVCKQVFVAHPLATFAAWQAVALELWIKARFREERYAAIELTGHRLYRRVGPILAAHPRPMKKTMLAWSRCDDLWKRRSSIIAQVAFKDDTDTALLEACIAPSIERPEFWLRKAIGWALRAYAWREPKWVVRYVKAHPQLSGLSRREALKNVG